MYTKFVLSAFLLLLFSSNIFAQGCPPAIPPNTPVLLDMPFFNEPTMGGGQHYNRILALPNGNVLVAGYNSNGQHGTGLVNFNYTNNAYQQVPLIANAVLVDAGMSTHVALKSDSTVWSWGSNWEGKIGDGTYGLAGGPDPQPTPQQALLANSTALTNVIKVQSGMTFTVALTSNHHAYAWGKNSGGAFGPSFSAGNNYPFASELRDVGFNAIDWAIDIDQGEAFIVLLRWDGTVWVMGSGTYGQMGNNSTNGSVNPVAIVQDPVNCTLLSDIISISAGRRHILALKADSTVWAWGLNAYGQIGDNNAGTNALYAKQVIGPGCTGVLNNIIKIEGSGCNSYAIDVNGDLYAWGCDDNGNIGNGNPTQPEHCPILVENNVLEVSGCSGYNAGGHAMIKKQNGDYCFAGTNGYGIAGTGLPWLQPGPDLTSFQCWSPPITTNTNNYTGVQNSDLIVTMLNGNYLEIKAEHFNLNNSIINLIDLTGRNVIHKTVNTNNDKIKISTNKLKPGYYSLRIVSNSQVVSKLIPIFNF